MRRVNPEFGERVKALLAEHGLSLRGARIRTGVDHVTISDMASGYIPRVEQVEAFARGFALDVNEWRELAGYSRVESRPSPAALLGEGIQELGARYGVDRLTVKHHGGLSHITYEDVERILAELEEDLQAEAEELRQAEARKSRGK